MGEQKTTSFPVMLFYAYAHTDEKLRQKLEKHLSVLSLQGLITTWHDRQIAPGTNWKQALDDHLNTASIILLLISPDFIASDYSSSVEMQQALARHEEGNACVIPILLRPTNWEHTPFSSLQALPGNDKPVTSWSNQDAAFVDITKGIRRVLETLGPTFPMMQNPGLVTPSSRRNQHWNDSQREMIARLKYLKHIEERYTFITPLPLGPVEGFSLRAVFQPLALRRDPVLAEDYQREARCYPLGEPALSENEPRVIAENGEEALAKSPQNRIIVLGGPGMGKTTLLQSLISERIQQSLIDPTAPIPILLSLPDLARSSKTLPEYLTHLMKEAGISEYPTDLLWRTIEEGRAFICLDSLDEVTPRERTEIIRLINELAVRSGNTWVVGSRFTEYKGGQLKRGQFAEWELLPLDHEMREQLALRLLPELHRLLPRTETSVAPESSMLVQHLEHHQRAAAWGENPLLFSLAATVFARIGTFPTSFAALYQQIIDAVVQLREPDPTRQKMLLRVVAGLALELYQRKGRTFTREDIVTLLPIVRQRQHENWSTEELVNRIVASGLLDVVAQETYGFRHQTFQEYLAAVELAQRLVSQDREIREPGWSFVWSKRTYSRWTEILRLMVGVLVLNHHREGVKQALRWLYELGKQRESDDGDIGNLGLALALRSLPEISTRPISSLPELWGEEVKETIITSWIAALRESIDEENSPHSLQQRNLLDLSNEISRLGHPLASMTVEKLLECLNEKDGRVRRIALKALVPFHECLPVEPFLALLNDPDNYVLGEAVRLLGKMKARAPVDHLLNLLDHEEWYVRQSAEDALVACREHVAIESLKEALTSENWWTRTSAAKVLARRGERVPVALFLADLSVSDWKRRRGVIEFFGLLSDDAPIEPLLSVLGDESWFVRLSASKSLGMLGKQVPVEAVLQALQSANPATRGAAASTLADLTKQVLIPVAPLIEALGDVDNYVRSGIAQALGHIRVSVPVEPLLKALRDEDRYVRWFAADALVKIGTYPSGEQIVREIASHLVWMRLMAWQVLSLVSQYVPAETLLIVLTNALNDAEGSIRAEAVKIMPQLGEYASIEPIVQALRDHDPRVRRAAAAAMGKMGKDVPIEPLLEAFYDQETQVQQEVIRTLAVFGEQVPVEPFLQALQDERASMRVAATNVLGELGTRTPINSLLHALHDSDPAVRSIAVRAIGRQTGHAPMEALVGALEDEQDMVRRQAVNVLGTLGSQAPVERLLMMLHDTSKDVRSAAVRVLGERAESVPLESLLALVHHEDVQVRVAAFQIIGHLKQSVSLDILSEAMNDEERQVRVAAIHTVGKRGAHELLPRLFSFLENEEQETRVAAIKALERLAEEVPVEPLLQALRSPWQDVRIGAATVLGSVEESHAMQALLTMLDDQDKRIEPAVVRALGRFRTRAAIEPLCNILHNSARPSTRRVAVEVLAEIGEPAAVKALLTVLYDADRDVFLREAVVKSLGKLEEGLSTEPLRLALGDSEQRIRDAAIAVFQQRSPDALCNLISEALAIVQGGESGSVLGSMAQGVIADTIGRLTSTSPSLLEHLTDLLDWPYWQVRMQAAQALGRLRRNIPDAAIRGLLRLLNDPQSRAVRYAANDALTAILSLETGIEDD